MTPTDYGIHVVVQQAKHCPKVCAMDTDNKPVAPNCYISCENDAVIHPRRHAIHSNLLDFGRVLVGNDGRS